MWGVPTLAQVAAHKDREGGINPDSKKKSIKKRGGGKREEEG